MQTKTVLGHSHLFRATGCLMVMQGIRKSDGTCYAATSSCYFNEKMNTWPGAIRDATCLASAVPGSGAGSSGSTSDGMCRMVLIYHINEETNECRNYTQDCTGNTPPTGFEKRAGQCPAT
jgi:hypothetical protein